MPPAPARTRLAVPKSELPPGGRTVVRNGRREILLLNVAGRPFAIFNRCPHQQAPLSYGSVGGTTLPCDDVDTFEFGLEGRILSCPWHHYEFDLENGRCLADPKRLRVATYRVEDEGDEFAVYC